MARKHKLTRKGWIRKSTNQLGNEYVFWRYADYIAARETKGYKNNQEYISNSELQALSVNANLVNQQNVDLISQYFNYIKDLESMDVNEIQDKVYREFVDTFQQNVHDMVYSLIDTWIMNRRKTVTNFNEEGLEIDIKNFRVKLSGTVSATLMKLPGMEDNAKVGKLVKELRNFLQNVYMPKNYECFILNQDNFNKIQALAQQLDDILRQTGRLPSKANGERQKFNDLVKAVSQIIYSEHLINKINGDLLELLPVVFANTIQEEEKNIAAITNQYLQHFVNATSVRVGNKGVTNAYKNTNFSTNFHNNNQPINTTKDSYYKITTNTVQNKTDVIVQILKQDYNISLKNLSYSASRASLVTNTNLFTLLRDYPRFLEHFLNLYTRRQKSNAPISPGDYDMFPLNELRTSAVRAMRILMLNTSLRGGTRLKNEAGQYMTVPLTDYLVVYQGIKGGTGSFYVVPMANLISNMIQRTEKMFDTGDWRSQPVILSIDDKEMKTKVDVYKEMSNRLISKYKDNKKTPPNFLNARQRSAEVFLKTREINMNVALRMSQIKHYAQHQW